jgi:hypothetical protein
LPDEVTTMQNVSEAHEMSAGSPPAAVPMDLGAACPCRSFLVRVTLGAQACSWPVSRPDQLHCDR